MYDFRLPLRTVMIRELPRNILILATTLLFAVYFPVALEFRVLLPLLGIVATSFFFSWRVKVGIWFSLSQQGFHGKTFFYRKFVIPWDADVHFSSIAHFFQGKPAGITMRELDKDGVPGFRSIFLPSAITGTKEFRDAMLACAPPRHPALFALKVVSRMP